LRFTFRYRNRDNKKTAIGKGSEFRTAILLVRERKFWEERRRFQRAINFLKEKPY
jgi:hypothetical protein